METIENKLGQQWSTGVEGPASQRYAVAGKQVEQGVLKRKKLGLDVLVLSDGWPSWLLALRNEEFDSINCWASFDSLTSKLEFEATGLGSHLLTQADLLPWLESHSTSCLLLIQGPRPFFEQFNRWRKVQNKQGGLPNLPMSQLYVEITQALSSKLRFSKSL